MTCAVRHAGHRPQAGRQASRRCSRGGRQLTGSKPRVHASLHPVLEPALSRRQGGGKEGWVDGGRACKQLERCNGSMHARAVRRWVATFRTQGRTGPRPPKSHPLSGSRTHRSKASTIAAAPLAYGSRTRVTRPPSGRMFSLNSNSVTMPKVPPPPPQEAHRRSLWLPARGARRARRQGEARGLQREPTLPPLCHADRCEHARQVFSHAALTHSC